MPDLQFRFAEPPVPADEARRVADFVGRFLREEYLHAILLGEFSAQAHFIAGLGLAGSALAGACWAGWGRGFPDIGVVGGVATAESHRGRGVATALVGGACERFDAAGGRLLYLGTMNPVARRIYGRLGFRPVGVQRQTPAGETTILCRAAPDAAPDEGFAPGRKVIARPASWRDMAAIAPLYLAPHPCVLTDAAIALPSSRVVAPRRCVRIFWELWKSAEQGGRWSVLQNEPGWIVASAIARPDAPEPALMCHHEGREGSPFVIPAEAGIQNPTTAGKRAQVDSRLRGNDIAGAPRAFCVDFLWHPDYSVEACAFVAAWLEEVEAAADGPCAMLVCEGDDWKMREARKLGFERVEGAGGAVELDGRAPQLLRLRRHSR